MQNKIVNYRKQFIAYILFSLLLLLKLDNLNIIFYKEDIIIFWKVVLGIFIFYSCLGIIASTYMETKLVETMLDVQFIILVGLTILGIVYKI